MARVPNGTPSKFVTARRHERTRRGRRGGRAGSGVDRTCRGSGFAVDLGGGRAAPRAGVRLARPGGARIPTHRPVMPGVLSQTPAIGAARPAAGARLGAHHLAFGYFFLLGISPLVKFMLGGADAAFGTLVARDRERVPAAPGERLTVRFVAQRRRPGRQAWRPSRSCSFGHPSQGQEARGWSVGSRGGRDLRFGPAQYP